MSQTENAKRFWALHQREGAFILPNPWDVGTARLLVRLGFEALATTSAGFAFSLGRRDYALGRELVLAHVTAIVSASEVPVSADLENGFGDAPETVAETIRLAAATGLAGGSIEDATGREEDPIYGLGQAVERISAAAEAAHSLACPFTLTGRAENYLHGRRDLKDTIGRLQAYQEAGADVLYAPGLTTREEISTLVRSVDRPVNVLMGIAGIGLGLSELSELGVKRVSVGSALSRVALGAFLRASKEMIDHGTFSFTREAVGSNELNEIFD